MHWDRGDFALASMIASHLEAFAIVFTMEGLRLAGTLSCHCEFWRFYSAMISFTRLTTSAG
jgi:hypothetical protein